MKTLSAMLLVDMARAWIGTSGFNYKHWSGTFYPADLPASKWLAHYEQQFDTVELNVTFYRLPQPAAFRRWFRTTHDDFAFVIKGSRFVTHIKRLKEAELSIPRLMNASAPLQHKRSCVLWQLPPQMKVNVERLQDFVSKLQADKAARRVRHAFEFRHDSWFCDPVFRTLRDGNMAIVHADMRFEVVPPQRRSATSHPRVEAPATADWWYLRRHGPTGVHTGYTSQQTELDAAWIRAALDEGEDIYVFFNNDVGTHAPRDALALRSRVGARATSRTLAPLARQSRLA